LKDPKVFLKHILESILLIKQYTEPLTKEDFVLSLQSQDAVIRRLEIIGEAVKNLPIEFISTYPAIPWRQIAGMRDVLIHKYFGVDLSLTWETVQNDILTLETQINEILKGLEP
jgi:uncharacterized protein with HEPN domain